MKRKEERGDERDGVKKKLKEREKNTVKRQEGNEGGRGRLSEGKGEEEGRREGQGMELGRN